MTSNTLDTSLAPREASARQPAPAPMSLGRLLHGLGALVVVAAFSVFLFQQWAEGNDLSRYGLLLGNTLLLAGAGLASGLWLREAHGARLLVGLALAAVPVNFAILGGLSFPYVGGQPAAVVLPDFVIWDAGSAVLAWASIGVSLPVLGAAAWLAFRVLARRSALPLAGLYGLGNGALLVPTREGEVVAAMVLGLAAVMVVGAARLAGRDPTLATGEGRFARAVLVLPLVVLGGRSLLLYGPQALLEAVLAVIAYAAFREARRRLDGRCRALWTLELAALVAAMGVVAQVAALLPPAWTGDWVPTGLAGVLAAFLLDLARAAPARAGRYRAAAAWLLVAVASLNLQAVGGFGAALACLAASVALLVGGYQTRSFGMFTAGGAGTLAALATAVHQAVAHFSLGGWTSLALLGVVTIVAGSLVERRGGRLVPLVAAWRSRFREPAKAEAG